MRPYIAALLLVSMLISMSACTSPSEAPTESANFATTAPTEVETTAPSEQTDPVAQQLIPSSTPTQLDISNFHYELKEVGSFITKDDLLFTDQIPLFLERDENDSRIYTLLSHLGEDMIGETCNSYDYFGNGITAIYRKGTEVPTCKLVNIDTGEVYLADDAVQIEQLNERFYYVVYVTERTENRDECFIYFTDQMLSLGPDEDDVLYKGYSRIYDLEKAQFVGNLQGEIPEHWVLANGDTVCIAKSYDLYDVYLDNGSIISDVKNLALTPNGFIQKSNGNCVLYDTELNELCTVPNATPLSLHDPYNHYSDHYFLFGTDWDRKGIIDRNGTMIVPDEYKFLTCYFDDYFIVANDEKKGVYHADGSVLIPVEYDGVFGTEYPGFRMTKEHGDDEETFLYVPGRQVMSISEYHGSPPLLYQYVDGASRTLDYLIPSSGDTLLIKDYENVVGAIVASEQGVMEMIHGTTLIEQDFSRVIGTDEYIYAYKDGMWTVYSWDLLVK